MSLGPDRPRSRTAEASRLVALLALWLLCLASSSLHATRQTPLELLQLAQARDFFPAATALGVPRGDVPVRPVLGGQELLGYVFLSDDITPMPAYSGRPIRTLIGLDLAARVRGARILQHEEPILVIGITDQDLQAFTDQFTDLQATEKVRIGAHRRVGYRGIDGISGATITAMVLNTSIMKSARQVAESHGLPRPAAPTPAQTGQAPDTRVVSGIRTPVEAPTSDAAQTPAGVATIAPSAEPPDAPEPLPENTAGSTSSIAPVEEPPIWVELWEQQAAQLIVLCVALLLLMIILFFQDWLVIHTALFQRVRIGYLLFTVFYLGFYAKAQLSVVNLLAFMRILFGGFSWDTLLIDPMIFLLWGFVAVSIILWGRGVFCGWLCPFGALQELVHKVAERFQWPTYEFPPMVHERLWAIKYFILIALVGLSLESMIYAARLAEIEPFKTTFVMRFNREIWFVVYALALLVIAVFNSKFYCKYLCPLGAGLSFFTRFRIFDWLRRRKECGTPCQSCAAQCQISAIKPTGEIIDNECHYCLECQVTYWDEHRCPPLVEKRKKRETREKKKAEYIASDQGRA